MGRHSTIKPLERKMCHHSSITLVLAICLSVIIHIDGRTTTLPFVVDETTKQNLTLNSSTFNETTSTKDGTITVSNTNGTSSVESESKSHLNISKVKSVKDSIKECKNGSDCTKPVAIDGSEVNEEDKKISGIGKSNKEIAFRDQRCS